MNTIIKMFALVLFCASCGLGLEDKSVQNTEVKRQKDRLTKLGEQIKGTYEGEIEHSDGNSYPLELRLYYINEVVGKDENGDIYTLPRLKGQIRYLNFVYPDEERQFEVRFDESGVFQMLYTPDVNKLSAPTESILGSLKAGLVIADWTSKGFVGAIKLSKKSSVVRQIEESERRTRLRKQYEKVIGYYAGELFSFSRPDELYGILNITLDYDDSLGQTGLIARFQMTDSVLFQEFQRVPVSWDPRTKIFDFDYTVGKSRMTGSGVLNDMDLSVEKLRFAAEPFVYRAIH